MITTAVPFSGATFPALSWTPVDGATSYEVQDVWPDAQRARHVGHPEHRGQLHEDDRHRARHGAGARGVHNDFRSAYTPTRDVVHTIAEPGGSKTQLINKPGKLALTFAWNTKTNVKQYKVQVSRTPGFTSTFLDDTTDQSSYTPMLTEQSSSTAAPCTGASP